MDAKIKDALDIVAHRTRPDPGHAGTEARTGQALATIRAALEDYEKVKAEVERKRLPKGAS